jgi:hypothetical protein
MATRWHVKKYSQSYSNSKNTNVGCLGIFPTNYLYMISKRGPSYPLKISTLLTQNKNDNNTQIFAHKDHYIKPCYQE